MAIRDVLASPFVTDRSLEERPGRCQAFRLFYFLVVDNFPYLSPTVVWYSCAALWPFRRKPTPVVAQPSAPPYDPQAELLKTLLGMEQLRLEKSAALEERRQEIELKKAELELSDLERIGHEKRKQQLFAEQLKERQRKHAADMRERKKQKAAQAQPGLPMASACEECNALREGRAPKHSSDLMRHAFERHSLQFTNGIAAN